MALNAGTDSEMVSTNIRDFGEQLLAQGRISMARLDDAVRRILRVKFRAGLFEHPYVDWQQAESKQLLPDAVAAARKAAGRSMVLLKNDNGTLPLDPTKKTAVIGPLGNDGHDMLGPWWGTGRDEDAVTVYDGIKAQSPNDDLRPGLRDPGQGSAGSAERRVWLGRRGSTRRSPQPRPPTRSCSRSGETRGQSGEAASRSNIDLPGKQQELIDAHQGDRQAVRGRAVQRPPADAGQGRRKSSPAILEAWFPGVQAGNAVADVLFGKVNPGGKLPVSFPRSVGQVPIYYNHEPTGRPVRPHVPKYNSRYRDLPTCDPLYPFGYGLSYTTFDVSNLRLSSRHDAVQRQRHGVGGRQEHREPQGDEVVQLYIHDPVASISQPVRRLRGFERVTLAPGQTKTVTFTLDRSDVGFYDNSRQVRRRAGHDRRLRRRQLEGGLKDSFTVTVSRR